jgi:hypothetical protein
MPRLRLAFCLVALAMPAAAGAQVPPTDQPTQSARDAARAMAEKGYELYEAGKYAEAMVHFRLAEERFHASPHLLFIARSYVKLGKLVRGRDAYAQVIAEKLANYAPDAFRQAQADARRELGELQPRIPTIRLVVIGAEPESVRVTIDGAEVPSSSRQESLAVDPGAHTIVATRAGAQPITRSVMLVEGAAESVELGFAATAAPPAPAPPPEDPQPKASLVPAIIAFSVGGVALAVGTVTGSMSLSKVSDIEDSCPDAPSGDTELCDPKYRSEADEARTLGTVSTVGFVLGGVGVAAGVVLLFTAGVNRAPAAPSAARGARSTPTVRPMLGLGSAGLAGSF